MKLDILTFCLLCFHFEPCFGDGVCLFCEERCKENHNISTPEAMDGLPRKTLTFHCPLTAKAVGFHMKLFKGHGREEMCTFYAENRTEQSSTGSCNPVLSANSVSFELRNLSKEVNTYTCCLEILVPVYSCCHTSETYLYIQDSEECFLSEFASWLLAILTAFSTSGCICCFLFCCIRNLCCQHSSRSHDYNNEYMSMAAVKPNEKSRHELLRRPIAI
ncbi:uncharacterized protein LOC129324885 [Eublepharis macularius]|uniref:Uncharacterized protein LOC129324885 n=1 Tax=Eublepharis macularius TaxID=481883 RepID=A0AA97IZ64_EUBMA|nr:uncharacterized protein LOC129324885 [Eublepharis macularius]